MAPLRAEASAIVSGLQLAAAGVCPSAASSRTGQEAAGQAARRKRRARVPRCRLSAGAVDNFIAFLGWSPGTTEDVLTMEELIAKFSIEKIQPSPAMANLERLDWLNGQFIRRLSTDELATRLASRMPGASPQALAPLAPLVWQRLRTLNESPDMLRFFFEEPDSYRAEQLTPTARDATAAAAALTTAAATLNELAEW